MTSDRMGNSIRWDGKDDEMVNSTGWTGTGVAGLSGDGEMRRERAYRDQGGDDLGCIVGKLLVLRLIISFVVLGDRIET
jgi:hypothetical protein